MAVPENQYVVLPETIDGKKRGERWFEVLRRWLVECRQCSEIRLVVGAHENDEYLYVGPLYSWRPLLLRYSQC
jgi:hypothetical protein